MLIMIYRNKIKELLEAENLSVQALSKQLKRDYSNTHDLVNDEYLDFKRFANIADVARILDVKIEDLFEVQNED